MRRLKRVKLNDIPIRQTCSGGLDNPNCEVKFTHYRWSPFWCPSCDEIRLKRIDESLEKIIKKLSSVSTG